jgi:hypothetical protein
MVPKVVSTAAVVGVLGCQFVQQQQQPHHTHVLRALY